MQTKNSSTGLTSKHKLLKITSESKMYKNTVTIITQLTLTYSKSTIETPEGVKHGQS